MSEGEAGLMRGLKGKIVVTAGGAGGIGTATSVRLAEEGASVVVADLDAAAAQAVAEQIVAAGGSALATGVDIEDEASVEELFSFATASFGGVDCVHVNAADLSRRVGPDTDAVSVDLAVFDHTLAVNLRGHLLVTRAAIPLMLTRGGGSFAYTSSAASYAGEAERISYGVSKAGVNALMRHVASRWGKEGIRANAVAPGLVITDTIAAAFDEAMFAGALSQTRGTRLGTPEDAAALFAFLLSDDAGYITGQVIGLDGGTFLR